MTNVFNFRWSESLFERPLKSRRARTFKNVLYVIVSIECFYWILHYTQYFSAHSFVFRTTNSVEGWREGAYLLYHHPSWASYFIAAVLGISACALLYDRRWIVADLCLFFLITNLHYAAYPGLTSGNFLVNQFLLFGALLSGAPVTGNGWQKDLRLFTHNCGVIALLVQVCLLYLISGALKLMDESWIAGTALEHVSRLRHFSGYLLPEQLHFTGLTSKLIGWSVIAFQLLFPLLVWLRPVKKWLLIGGGLMHLYIAFSMGLTLFGLVMIAGYILFWPQEADSISSDVPRTANTAESRITNDAVID